MRERVTFTKIRKNRENKKESECALVSVLACVCACTSYNYILGYRHTLDTRSSPFVYVGGCGATGHYVRLPGCSLCPVVQKKRTPKIRGAGGETPQKFLAAERILSAGAVVRAVRQALGGYQPSSV